MKKKKRAIPSPLLAFILYTVGVLLMILGLKYFTVVAAPLLFSFIIAYLFNPIVNFLEKKLRFSRGLVAAILMVTLLLILIFVLVNLFPYIIDQATSAAVKFPELLEKFSGKMKVFSNYITKNFSEYVGDIDIMKKVEEMFSQMFTNLSKILAAAFSSLYSIVLTLLYMIIIPLFAFYFIKDYKKIQKSFFSVIPSRLKQRVIKRVEKMDALLSSFIRGQAIVVLILAVLYSVGLGLIGLPFAILIGTAAGIGDIVPYFGTIVGFVVSLIVGLAHFQSVQKMLLIVLVFAIIKGGENWYIYPKIVGREVGLHFVWVLMSIIIFGNLFGFWGLLVAIPSSAGFKMFANDLIKYYKHSVFFKRE